MTTTIQPKQDRSRLTHQRLLESSIECLAELGWQASTIAVIARRAGISRGAAQHHFPTREDLILAALDYMFDQRSILARETPPLSSTGLSQVEFVVQQAVDLYTGTLFRASLQVYTAATADETLRNKMLPLERKFAREVHGLVVRLLDVDDADPHVRGLIQATLDMARGLGLADTLRDDSRRRQHVISVWSRQLAAGLGRA